VKNEGMAEADLFNAIAAVSINQEMHGNRYRIKDIDIKSVSKMTIKRKS